jgi:hypothetical protein
MTRRYAEARVLHLIPIVLACERFYNPAGQSQVRLHEVV